ncbi:carboxypeptidase SOL1 isoform X2 [Silene latifolia]
MEISDNPGREEPEPAFKFIGNVHGDEPVGRELLILLANWLCDNYVKDPLAKFIVENVHLHILPSMNPDGFALRKRGNAKNVDLNRDFPDQFFSNNNVEDGRQPETKAIMRWLRRIQFTASASLHGGALVANYPWDGTQSKRRDYYACPDDETFRYLAGVYSHSHYNMSLSKEFPEGITNGAAWYPIYGGMQDWNYIHAGCLELTLEISDNKWPNASELPTIWEYNRMSMLNLVATVAKNGVHGRIFSSDNGKPLPASIMVEGINQTMKARVGLADYHRLLAPKMKYEVKASMPGYKSKSTAVMLENVTTLDFILDPEAGRVSKVLETACDCTGTTKSNLEVVDILAHPQLEVSLLVVVTLAFLLLLLTRKFCLNPPKQRQLPVSKRPIIV